MLNRALFASLIFLCISPVIVFSDEKVYIEEGDSKQYLKRAFEYEGNKKWYEAIEYYIESSKKYPDTVYRVEDNRYVGIKQYFYRQLLKYPEELAAFRDMFDARAESLLKNALAESNLHDLAKIINGMFLSTCGDQTADLLADIAFEEGRLEEALFYWDMVLNSYPDSDIPKEIIYYKISCALNYLEKEERYQEILTVIQNKFSDKIIYIRDIPCKADKGIKIIGSLSATATAGTGLNWPVWGGNNAHDVIPDCTITGTEKLWELDFSPISKPKSSSLAQYPWYYPIIAGDKIFINSGSSLRAIDIRSAKLKGIFPAIFEGRFLEVNPSVGNKIYNPLFSCAFDNGRIYLNMVEPRLSDNRNGKYSSLAHIACVHADTCDVIWDSRVIEDEVLKDVSFFSPPLIFNNHVFSAAVKNKGMEMQIYLSCFNGDDGSLLWNRFICSRIGDAKELPLYMPTPTIAESNGIVYCLTNSGILAAISAGDGSINWLVDYADDIAVPSKKTVIPASYPVIIDNVVYATPLDNPRVFGFNVKNGNLIKASGRGLPIGKNIYIAGLAGDSLALANNNNEVFFFTVRNSKIKDTIKISEDIVSGRGFVTKYHFYIPTLKSILKFDIINKKLVDEIGWSEATDAGNIIVFGNYILSVSERKLSLYGAK